MLPPDRVGRAAILRSTRAVPLGDDVDLERDRRRRRPAWSAPTSPTLVNEAALFAARREHARSIEQRDFTDAIEKIVLGTERADRDERRRPRAHRLPRGRPRARRHAHARRRPGAQGLDHPARPGARRDALARPTPTATTTRASELLAPDQGALGGRAAEQVVYGDVTTGRRERHPPAHDDRPLHGHALGHERRDRPGVPGLREPATCPSSTPRRSTPRCGGSSRPPRTRRSRCYAENRSKLDALVARLLEKETLDQDEVYEVVGMPLPVPGRRARPEPEPTAAA